MHLLLQDVLVTICVQVYEVTSPFPSAVQKCVCSSLHGQLCNPSRTLSFEAFDRKTLCRFWTSDHCKTEPRSEHPNGSSKWQTGNYLFRTRPSILSFLRKRALKHAKSGQVHILPFKQCDWLSRLVAQILWGFFVFCFLVFVLLFCCFVCFLFCFEWHCLMMQTNF